MAADPDIYRSAMTWLELHGDEAVPEARKIVTVMRERGDLAGADRWLLIIVALYELRPGITS